MPERWDYIIVGAGSAGCVLANRLSANPKNKVLLLEAGGRDDDLTLKMPAGLVKAIFDDRFNWKYPCVPDPSRRDLEYTWSGGKGLGGSSSINGMLYIRGAAEDYDGWARDYGCVGWDYAALLPRFKAIECFEGGADAYRGGDGPLSVTFPATQPPVIDAVITAAQECGHAYTPDYNGAQFSGVGLGQGSIRKGRRASASRAFLRPINKRPNLEVRTDAHAARVTFEGKRANGVTYLQNGAEHHAACGGEIILAAGAIGSPGLLMRSGIGPGAALNALGIPVLSDKKSVGRNLMEHPGVYVKADTTVATFNRAARPANLPFVVLNWLLRGKGPAAVGTALAQVMGRSDGAPGLPDVQLLLSLVTFTLEAGASKPTISKKDGIAMACCLMTPKGRGAVKLTSADPNVPPMIDHALIGEDDDVRRLASAAGMAVEILNAPALENIVTDIDLPLEANAPLDEWREYLSLAAFRGDHPCGTAAMGADEACVLDPQLRVRGVEGLRIADASIMPIIPRANTNAACLMIGEKAASMILETAS